MTQPMTQLIFSDPPSVELLQWLARRSLKQNLSRAVRLWVWLRLLYGDESEHLNLKEPFTYTQWRDAFLVLRILKEKRFPSIVINVFVIRNPFFLMTNIQPRMNIHLTLFPIFKSIESASFWKKLFP